MYRIHVHLDPLAPSIYVPSSAKMKAWVKTAVRHKIRKGEIALVITTLAGVRKLNKNYRHKDKPTNVLSFIADTDEHLPQAIPLIGDIVICAQIVNREAKTQGKSLNAHWAHIVMHGCLHILGYDHEDPDDAELMEGKEIRLLKTLGYPNPYLQD